jgi:excisionase family DNA binding protein
MRADAFVGPIWAYLSDRVGENERMTRPADNRYLAPSEVADLLNVSKSSVYRALEAGTLPHVQLRPNGAARIPATALEARSRRPR